MSLHTIRAFLVSTVLIVISSCTSTPASAYKWGIGDHIASYVLCRNELIIMEIVKADIESESDVISIVNKMISSRGCLAFSQPIKFVVIDIIADYKDFMSRQSYVLKVRHNVNKHVEGYVIASGEGLDAI